MPHSKRARDERQPPDPPADPLDATRDRVPPRRRGGQELPDNVQDRPEQNAGYDEAVHEPTAESETPLDPAAQEPLEDIGDPAEGDLRAEVRRRQRSD